MTGPKTYSTRCVLQGASVYPATGAPAAPASVIIRNGLIDAIGPQETLRHRICPDMDILDVTGGLILPGFRDAHIHPLLGGMNLLECNLTGLTRLDDYLARVADYAQANPDQDFIRGGGWLPDAPVHRALLDAIAPERPVFLKSIDGHSAWVNSKALKLAGIGPSTPDPQGGRIEKDARNGEPIGLLREWSAMDLVEALLPAPTLQTRVLAGWAFLQEAARLGIVSAHEAMAHEEELLAYAALEQEDSLTMSIRAALLCEPELGMGQIEHLVSLRDRFSSRLIRPGAVKLFVDGVIEGHTAKLLDPYADRSDYRGEALWEPETLNRITSALDALGFQMHYHAVGDAAVRMALDAVEQARRQNGLRDARHMIAHADLISKSDLPRFAALGVIANLQPLWFCREKHFEKTTLASLGALRAFELYRLRDLIAAGTSLACGSDWPFSGELNSFNPLEAIAVGVTRRGLSPDAPEAYRPDQRADVTTLLDAYTIGSARAGFQDDVTGSLQAGKSADIIVLDRDILSRPATDIAKAKVVLTLFGGRVVYRDI